MTARTWVLAAGLLVLVGLAAEPAAAQQQRPAQGAQATPTQQDTVRLVLEREVFSYPTFQRRNPFRALTGRDDGPRFEDLVLLGVIQTADPGASVALLGLRGGAEGGRTYRVRVGERLGNSRILQIRRQEVAVEVEEFGITETRILQLRRTEPEPAAPPADAVPDSMDINDSRGEPPSGGDPGPGDHAGDYANGGSS